jgi:hypothetical protein
MRRILLGLVVAGGLGLAGWAFAGDGKECPLKAAQASSCSKSCAEKAGSSQCAKELAGCPTYKRANELIKSWSEVPARLAAMNETDKSELMAAAEKMGTAHPAAAVMKPAMEFVKNSVATAVEIDAACAKMCADQCAKGEAAGESGCPKAKAAMAAAKLQMEKSAAMVAKANELLTVAFAQMGDECGKSACAKTAQLASAEEKAGCCSKSKATLAAAEEKTGGCAKSKATLAAAEEKTEGCSKPKATLAAAEEKSGCCSKSKATLAAAEEKSGGCAKSKATLAAAEEKTEGCSKPKATLAAAEEKSGCCSKSKATLAAAEEKSGGCAKSKATLASAEGEKGCSKQACAKTLTAKAEELAAQSGVLAAKLQSAGVVLASMDSADRSAIEKTCNAVMERCPVGSRMPETMATVADLLTGAAKMSAKCQAECGKNEAISKHVSQEMKDLCQARATLTAAALNVLEKMNGIMKPAKQVAMAQ